MQIANKSYVKQLILRNRKLIDDYLEVTNFNSFMSEKIKQLKELFLSFIDMRDVIPAADPHLRDQVVDTQTAVMAEYRLTSNIRHRLMYFVNHLGRFEQHVYYRNETLKAYDAIVDQKLAQMNNILLNPFTDDAVHEDRLTLQTVNELQGIQRLICTYHRKILKEYELTTRQYDELLYEIKQFSIAVISLKHEALNQEQIQLLDLLNFDEVAIELERRRVQLIQSWEQMRKDHEALLTELANELDYELTAKRDMEYLNQAATQLAPRPVPGSSGRNNSSNDDHK